MAACARKVFPEKVIAYVAEEVSSVKGDDAIPKYMLPSESMKRSRLKDSTVRDVQKFGVVICSDE